MEEWLVALSIIVLTLQFIKEWRQDRAVRKRQRNCHHSWVIEWSHPYSWCVRCQKHVPTESLVYLVKADLLH